MALWEPTTTTHLLSHLTMAYDPEHLALRLSVPAQDVDRLSPEARELFLESVVNCWKQHCPEWQLDELLLTLQPEEES